METHMTDEQLMRLKVYGNNVQRYRRLLKGNLTEQEREFVGRQPPAIPNKIAESREKSRLCLCAASMNSVVTSRNLPGSVERDDVIGAFPCTDAIRSRDAYRIITGLARGATYPRP
jgi:hypothetical protein